MAAVKGRPCWNSALIFGLRVHSLRGNLMEPHILVLFCFPQIKLSDFLSLNSRRNNGAATTRRTGGQSAHSPSPNAARRSFGAQWCVQRAQAITRETAVPQVSRVAVQGSSQCMSAGSLCSGRLKQSSNKMCSPVDNLKSTSGCAG